METKKMLVNIEVDANETLQAISEAKDLLRQAERVLYSAGIKIKVSEQEETASGN